mmetsp:Transcript_7997/g.22689  ORF Transcript_7997/g.22689 Transcript_7997/m.22689 type:complete len:122 (-) Transcript_7997:1595-1960(-)
MYQSPGYMKLAPAQVRWFNKLKTPFSSSEVLGQHVTHMDRQTHTHMDSQRGMNTIPHHLASVRERAVNDIIPVPLGLSLLIKFACLSVWCKPLCGVGPPPFRKQHNNTRPAGAKQSSALIR